MSAFMISDDSLSRLAQFFADLRYENESPLMYLRCPFGFMPSMPEETAQAMTLDLAERMWEMNAHALNARYGDDSEMCPDGPFEWVAQRVEPCRPWQVLKSLDCLMYQCSEGNVPETSDLFKKLDKFRASLSRILASHTAEYDAAKWA